MPPRFAISILIALACTITGGVVGWKLRDRDYQAHLKQDAQQETLAVQTVRAIEGAADRITNETREAIAKKAAEREIVTRTITKEIPPYVTKTVFTERIDAGGGLPAGFVWVHNQAASGSTAPLPPGVDPDAPTGIGMPELADTLVHNYGECHAVREEAQGWRDWYVQLKKGWPTGASPDSTSAKENTHE